VLDLYQTAALANDRHGGKIWRGIADGIIVDFNKRALQWVVLCTHYASAMKQFGGTIEAGRGRFARTKSKYIPMPIDRTRPIRKADTYGKLKFMYAPHGTKHGYSPGFLAPLGTVIQPTRTFGQGLARRRRESVLRQRSRMLFELVSTVTIPPDPIGGWLPKPHEVSRRIARTGNEMVKR
jgi:hypothetical protein